MSEAEWELMKVVWTYGEVTSRFVIDMLEEEHQWAPSTVKTLLKRLVDKGCLAIRKEGRTGYYHATMSQQEAEHDLLYHDLNKICETKQALMMSQFLEEIPMTKEDAKQMIAILESRLSHLPNHIDCHCTKGKCQCRRCQDEGTH